jgi:hypothetical protein
LSECRSEAIEGEHETASSRAPNAGRKTGIQNGPELPTPPGSPRGYAARDDGPVNLWVLTM